MPTGRVKWFNNAKGYGFVRPDHGGDDLFVHYSYIAMEGYKTLKAGQPVNFEVKEAGKGNHAINLTLIDEHPTTPHSSAPYSTPG
jgi:CspA family cold shock protein